MRVAKQRPRDIRARSFAYARRAIKLYHYLQGQKDGAGWLLGRQYLRSASSIGANLEEAQSGESRADFIHKLGVAQKEARESLCWLRLLAESGIVSQQPEIGRAYNHKHAENAGFQRDSSNKRRTLKG